ncbi:hypothetical protein [Xanthomonas phage JGB6]|nr:hypothetical protein [Xanthomonas phage JGB6]
MSGLEMRKAELRAGRALFFVDYRKLMVLREAKLERDREESPIQFRRNTVKLLVLYQRKLKICRYLNPKLARHLLSLLRRKTPITLTSWNKS